MCGHIDLVMRHVEYRVILLYLLNIVEMLFYLLDAEACYLHVYRLTI